MLRHRAGSFLALKCLIKIRSAGNSSDLAHRYKKSDTGNGGLCRGKNRTAVAADIVLGDAIAVDEAVPNGCHCAKLHRHGHAYILSYGEKAGAIPHPSADFPARGYHGSSAALGGSDTGLSKRSNGYGDANRCGLIAHGRAGSCLVEDISVKIKHFASPFWLLPLPLYALYENWLLSADEK